MRRLEFEPPFSNFGSRTASDCINAFGGIVPSELGNAVGDHHVLHYHLS